MARRVASLEMASLEVLIMIMMMMRPPWRWLVWMDGDDDQNKGGRLGEGQAFEVFIMHGDFGDCDACLDTYEGTWQKYPVDRFYEDDKDFADLIIKCKSHRCLC